MSMAGCANWVNDMQIGFIDFSKEERSKILSTLKLLGEQTALDELGIGVIRDAYADLLFPGISTLQTRAKYFVLIPYLFHSASEMAAAGKLHSGRELLQWLHAAEDKMVETLVQNSAQGETGIIGSNALKQKRSVKTRPSAIYWSGLRTFGIVQSERLMLSTACALTVQDAKEKREMELQDGDDSYDDVTAMDTGRTLFLPIRPEYSLEKETGILLTKKEAQFLSDCIARSFFTKNSLLAFLVKNKLRCNSFEEIPEALLSPELRRDYFLAREFSRFIYGAHIRYNVIYSEEKDDFMVAEFHAWRQDFLSSPFDLEPILQRVGCSTDLAGFCHEFLDAVNRNDTEAMDDIIVHRERQVKGTRAKLRKPEEYRYDPTHPVHFYALDFRFGRANVIIQDILAGLEGASHV